jgi:hypothetical protein
LPLRPGGDRRKPGRFDEANQVGRDRHDHFVAAAQKLQANGGAGLDIAAKSIGCQRKFHGWSLVSRRAAAVVTLAEGLVIWVATSRLG